MFSKRFLKLNASLLQPCFASAIDLSHLTVEVFFHHAVVDGIYFFLHPLFLLFPAFDFLLWIVASVWTSECRQAAVHIDLRQAVLLALTAVPVPQTRITHGQGQSVTAGPPVVQREIIHTLAKPESGNSPEHNTWGVVHVNHRALLRYPCWSKNTGKRGLVSVLGFLRGRKSNFNK